MWHVRNANTQVIQFTWDIQGTSQHGNGVVIGASGNVLGETFFKSLTEPDPNIARISIPSPVILRTVSRRRSRRPPQPA